MKAIRSRNRECLILAFIFICSCSALNRYQKQGELRLAGLEAPVTVMRDEKVLAVLPGGVSGRLFDKHLKDQIESFTNGNKVYWWFSDAAIKAHCRNTLVLNIDN